MLLTQNYSYFVLNIALVGHIYGYFISKLTLWDNNFMPKLLIERLNNIS